MEPDFKGWATKFGVKCSDGRTIRQGSFSAQNGAKVPLVWMHGHDKPDNVLGHVILEDRAEGVYAEAFFNSTPAAAHQKAAVEHGDIDSMSIYANRLVENNRVVSHGVIREVSLVLAGANAEAKIEHITIRHADGDEIELEDEVIIKMGLPIEHAEEPEKPSENEDLEHASVADLVHRVENMTDEERKAFWNLQETMSYVSSLKNMSDDQRQSVLDLIKHTEEENAAGNLTHAKDDPTIKEVLDTLNETQAAAVYDLIQQLAHNEGDPSMTNVFEKAAREKAEGANTGPAALSHDALKEIGASAKELGSYKAAVEGYALKHGIENIESLFPEPKDTTAAPQWLTRRNEWVGVVMAGISRTPFSRIRTTFADLTYDAARAKGYIKGNMKKEEFFGMFRRTTEPTTIYKKQKLDRDDIIDITSYDVTTWLKGEMRLMLGEECARAILIGDGREVDDEDKVKADKIRPIAYEDELYAASVELNIAPGYSGALAFIDRIVETRPLYKGSGTPTFFTTQALLTRLLLVRDADGHRQFKSVAELASELQVDNIVPVEPMEGHPDLYGVVVNLNDYKVGTDRGGEVTMFDDFDIDYNQYKYLAETRFAGALTQPRSAIVYRVAGADTAAVPVKPAFNQDTKVLTIPATTGVDYMIDGVVKAPGTYTLTNDTRVYAAAKTGFYIAGPFEAKYSPKNS